MAHAVEFLIKLLPYPQLMTGWGTLGTWLGRSAGKEKKGKKKGKKVEKKVEKAAADAGVVVIDCDADADSVSDKIQANPGVASTSHANSTEIQASPGLGLKDSVICGQSVISKLFHMSRGQYLQFQNECGVPKEDGEWFEAVPIPDDGNCQFASVFNGMKLLNDGDGVTAVHLRRHVMVFMALNLEFFLEDIYDDEMCSWNLEDGEPRHSSPLSYFTNLLDPTEWGGSATQRALGWMLRCGVSVFTPYPGGMERLVHGKGQGTGNFDVAILYNGESHFSGLGVYF